MVPPLTRSQLDKATADAAEFKAGFDKAVYDNAEQQAQVRCVAFGVVYALLGAPRCPVSALDLTAGRDRSVW